MTSAAADDRKAARRHLIPHFTKRRGWFDLPFPVIDRGEGAYVWDADGTRYLDGLSGLFCTNLGHGRTDLVQAAAEQLGSLAYTPSWGIAHTATVEASQEVAGVAPVGLDEVFFVSSGSEAVESAVKLARTYHLARGDESRSKVISREWAYHGTTLGALSLTAIPKLREPFAPMLWPGARHAPNTLGAADGNVEAVEAMILAEGPETVSLVLVEPVQNGRGALVPPPGYWARLREICDRHGVLLCADEVICGFGRLGHWFGSERVGGVPDLVTFAKGVTSAYVPLGGVVAHHDLIAAINESPLGGFVHGATFGGHPVATAVASTTIRAMAGEKVLDHVREHESFLAGGLERLADAHDTVAEVRGCGFFYYLELVGSRRQARPLTESESAELLGGLLSEWIWEAGLLIRADDRGATMLAVAPPLICGEDELSDLLARIDQVLDRVDQFVSRS